MAAFDGVELLNTVERRSIPSDAIAASPPESGPFISEAAAHRLEAAARRRSIDVRPVDADARTMQTQATSSDGATREPRRRCGFIRGAPAGLGRLALVVGAMLLLGGCYYPSDGVKNYDSRTPTDAAEFNALTAQLPPGASFYWLGRSFDDEPVTSPRRNAQSAPLQWLRVTYRGGTQPLVVTTFVSPPDPAVRSVELGDYPDPAVVVMTATGQRVEIAFPTWV